ncbi:MAG: hypothetical protein QM696_01520 [Steroidobacteraceae bacterium]
MNNFLQSLQNSSLAVTVAESWFPYVESIHVIALALVAGSIFVVDTRLIWKTSKNLPFTHVAHRLLPWTWGAFILAAITGTLLYISNATGYLEKTPFIIKFILMGLAGVNMAYFHLVTFRNVASWDMGKPPAAAIASGYLSLILWVGVLFFGRLIGFV